MDVSLRTSHLLLLGFLAGAHACSDGQPARHAPPSDAGADSLGGSTQIDASYGDADADLDAPVVDVDSDVPDGLTPTLPPKAISIIPETYVETEPSVAVGPDGRVLVAWIAYLSSNSESRIGYAFSSDGGEHFTTPQLLNGPTPGSEAGDPSVAFGNNGVAYLGFLGYTNSGPTTSNHVYLALAGPGSDTLGQPIQVDESGSADKPWVTTASDGRIYATWTQAGTSARIAVSQDGGKSFDRYTIGSAPQIGLVFPCLSPNATRVYATYVDVSGPFDAGQYSVAILARWSADYGETWSAAATVHDPSNLEPPSLDPPSCTASDKAVWFAYGSGTDPVAQATMARSKTLWVINTDPELGVDGRVAVPDIKGGDRYMHPGLVRSAAGTLHLVYFAGRDPDDGKASVRHSWSTAAGAIWSASSGLSDANLHLLTAKANLQWLGDYLGVSHDNTNLYVAFASNEGAASHVSFTRVPAP